MMLTPLDARTTAARLILHDLERARKTLTAYQETHNNVMTQEDRTDWYRAESFVNEALQVFKTAAHIQT